MNDSSSPRRDAPVDFARQAAETRPGVVRELVAFIRENKKWWLTPIIVVLLLFRSLARSRRHCGGAVHLYVVLSGAASATGREANAGDRVGWISNSAKSRTRCRRGASKSRAARSPDACRRQRP